MAAQHLEGLVEQLAARLDALEQENADLHAKVTTLEAQVAAGPAAATWPAPSRSAGTRQRVSRRGVLTRALGAAVATVGAGALLGQQSGTARADGIEGATEFSTGFIPAVSVRCTDPSGTGIDVAGPGATETTSYWGVYSTVTNGVGVFAQSANYTAIDGRSGSGTGVHGKSGSGNGVYGEGAGTGAGVSGYSPNNEGVYGNSDTGYGVYGNSGGSGTAGVYGTNGAGGDGVYGYSSTGASGHGVHGYHPSNIGVYGHSDTGDGVYGDSGSSDPSHGGVVGYNANGNGVYGTGATGITALGDTIGVAASSTTGRGGVFSGQTAQVQLTAGSAATHPASGAAGDLYVDSTARLWFCQGGTTWVNLTATTTVAIAAGWNLIGVAPGSAGLMASHVLSTLLAATGGHLAALYGLTNGQWTPSFIHNNTQTIGTDFPLAAGQGYLLYSDTALTSFTLQAPVQVSRVTAGGPSAGPGPGGGTLPAVPALPGQR